MSSSKAKWNRRNFLAGAGAVAAGAVSVGHAQAASRKVSVGGGFGASGNVYDELGVTTVINGQGTMTVLGGSLMRPEVETVMAEAAQHFVSIPDLEVAAGNRIAQMLKLPAGYTALVTSGAAGAMTSGLAGILTGDNQQFIKQVPDLAGMKSEVIIQKAHRYPFDHALRATGVKLIEIETRDDLRRAINPQTAMMHFTNFLNADGQIKVDEWVQLARQYKLPCFNDAAADTPPVSHLWDYANMGYDLIAFSGGKAIRGPQCAGLLLGRKDLVAYALLNNSPYEDTVGRGQKVGKEEIVGMIKALELYLAEDHDALATEWQHRLNTVASRVAHINGIKTSFFVPDVANHVPSMRISWDAQRIRITPEQVGAALRSSRPSIVLEASPDGLEMTSFMLKPGEEEIIAARLAEILKVHTA